jgi:hypothetical protein
MMSRAICALSLISLLLIGGCRTMQTPPSPPLPVSYYPAGRYLLAVPQGMKYYGMSHTINHIQIEEPPWERGDRAGQFRELWEPVLKQAKENYRIGASYGPSPQGGLAHEDVSELFGHEAVLLCYSNDIGGHNLDFFIALPEHILRITEDRGYDIGEECTDMTDCVLDFYSHYRPGWKNCSPDSFLTPKGRLEGLKIVNEYVTTSCSRDEVEGRPEIVLSMSESYLRRSDEPAPKISSLRKILKAHGAELEILRSRPRTVGKMPGYEELYTLSGKNNGSPDFRFYAHWDSNGEANNLERPGISFKIDCNGSVKDEAVRLWDAALDNFRSVRDWRESEMGRR